MNKRTNELTGMIERKIEKESDRERERERERDARMRGKMGEVGRIKPLYVRFTRHQSTMLRFTLEYPATHW
jgi:hypothetical protein